MEGYIKIHRKIINSEMWDKPSDWLKIWIYLLSDVFHKEWKQFKKWENFFKYDWIARECWVSYRTVQNCMMWLQEVWQIVLLKQARGVIVKVKNYSKYQSGSITDSITTSTTGVITGGNSIREEWKKYIDFWNKLFFKNHKATDDFINLYIRRRKSYKKEDIIKWTREYHIKNKDRLKDKEWINNYYLTPYKFIEQKKNWFINYL